MLKLLNLFKKKAKHGADSESEHLAFKAKYSHFKALLESNAELLRILSDIERKLEGHDLFGMSYVASQSARAVFHAMSMVQHFDGLSNHKYPELLPIVKSLQERIKKSLSLGSEDFFSGPFVLPLGAISKEMVDAVGGKSANLGEMQNHVHLPVPRGFAITTAGYAAFMDHNRLMDEIKKIIMEIEPADTASMILASERIQELFLKAQLPANLEEAIRMAYLEHLGDKRPKIAMRSSAIGEDGDLSFAGQYLSVLNVPIDKIVQNYKMILASLFTPRAISYRLHKGIPFESIAMSVACLEMVNSRASGVMYSRHPFDMASNTILINAVWGLGPYAVDGVVPPDTIILTKEECPNILDFKVGSKAVQLLCNPDGFLKETVVDKSLQNQPCLTDLQAKALAKIALKLEAHYQTPQDIEWALTDDDRLILLQTRPLKVEASPKKPLKIHSQDKHPLLIEGGAVSQPGVGAGPAFHIHSEDDLLRFPPGAVLIAEHSSPKYALVMSKAKAIITDAGSVTGHMASLTREYRVPSILNMKHAFTTIPEGQTLTVDAYSARVYLGSVPELLALELEQGNFMQGTPVFTALKAVADHIIPLNLVDPKSPEFSPKKCQTLHDVMRFIHELSYSQMFLISDRVTDHGRVSKKLIAALPLDLYIIDLGDGLQDVAPGSPKIRVEQISSIPFKALLMGMLNKDLRHTEPRPVQLQGFFSVMSEQMLAPSHMQSERFGDKSYALISDKYLNFSSRIGYHYSILDSYCGQTTNKNYIHFEFKGGAADDVRRNRRARAIAIMLNSLGFSVEASGDRVVARYQKYDRDLTEVKLDQLGRLLIFTRQMDMLMSDEGSVDRVAHCFLTGDYCYHSQANTPDNNSTIARS